MSEDWPNLRLDVSTLAPLFVDAAYVEGRVVGALEALGARDVDHLSREALIATAVDTSEIEGEHLRADSVRASLARRLARGHPGIDPKADAIVALTVDAVENARAPLTRARLWRWHSELLVEVPQGITVGRWRPTEDDPMRVVSGPVSARVVNFEAPPAARLAAEMRDFLAWFNLVAKTTTAPTAFSALAHLRFVTIHPFSDGNGRIARAIADLVLARGRPEAAPFVSLSRQILKERRAYYDALERAQRGGLDVTDWVAWFTGAYIRAAEQTVATVGDLVRSSRFWRDHADVAFNARQRIVLERYLGGGFEGWITSSKYAKLAKTSPDTAQRDIADLIAKNILVANDGKARHTSYRLTG